MNKSRFIYFTFSILSFLLISCAEREIPVFETPETSGYTNISGALSGTLHKSNSPFLVTNNIFIDSSKTLIIEPGVELHFEDNSGMIVFGNILITGTRENPILLTVNGESWKGISINGSGNSVIQFCTIENTSNINNPESDKSALTINNSKLKMNNCSFIDNSSQLGGALNITSSEVEIYNSIFRGNYSAYYGGAVFASNSTLKIINNAFYHNHCDNFGGGIVLDQNVSTIENNIFNRNSNRIGNPAIALINNDTTNLSINYNFFSSSISEPAFISEEDLHLLPGSPCINAGNPDTAFNDYDGTRNDQGAYGGPLGNW